MSAAAALLDRLGRPGGVRLATAQADTPGRLPSGLAPLDAVLGGGLPRGRVTEIVGPPGAGRTGLACAVAACATRAGETIAWVDAEDALDPEAAAAAGVALARTLWVRPRAAREALGAAEILLRAGGFGLVVLDLGDRAPVQPAAGALPSRLARAAEATRTTLAVVGARSAVGAFAALGLEVHARRICWSGGPGRLSTLDGIEACVRVVRSRLGRPGEAVVLEQAGA
jgi:hypothetical protein